ncbi:helix-turn-helix domain-containing protein [Chryseobacterium proteolyticum]|uniref:helix-turn-helix domain-containing protein n=1 Tax=Chryseobacterium proteolyticum TaxID=118127 RepID=UPI003983A6A1
MNSVIVSPEGFIQQLKDSLIPELTAKIYKELNIKQPTEYLTRDEVCKMLKIDKTTLWRWTKEKKIPSYGIGNRVYFIREEVDQVLLKNKIN